VKVLFFTKAQNCSSDLHFQKTGDKTKTVDLKFLKKKQSPFPCRREKF
jgi:hypothetical protein